MILFARFVETTAPFACGMGVALRISYSGRKFIAQGKVSHSEKGHGIGIRITSMEVRSAFVLDAWITELRGEGS